MATLFDAATGILAAAFAAAIGTLFLSSELAGIPWYLFALQSVAFATGSSVGFLRLFDFHRRLGAGYAVATAARMGILLLFAREMSLQQMLHVWVMVELASWIGLHAVGVLAVYRVRVREVVPESRQPTSREYVQYAMSLGATSTLRLLVREVDVVVAVKAFGAETAGMIRLGKSLALPPLVVVDLVYQALPAWYSRFAASGQFALLRLTSRRTALAAGTAVALYGAALYFLGPWLLERAGRSEYAPALPFALVFIPGVWFQAVTVGFLPTLTALGKASSSAFAMLVGACSYAAIAIPAIATSSPMLLVAAFPLHYLPWIAVMGARVRTALSKAESDWDLRIPARR
jgi:O-antigen/teichoic acid export membrane protein